MGVVHNSSALALNLGLFRGFRLDNYPRFPILSPTGIATADGGGTTSTVPPVLTAKGCFLNTLLRRHVRLDMTRSGGATSTR